jgi:hypothetical protein
LSQIVVAVELAVGQIVVAVELAVGQSVLTVEQDCADMEKLVLTDTKEK